MERELIFNYIPTEDPYNKTLRRLGYNKKIEEMSRSNLSVIQEGVLVAKTFCDGRGIYKLSNIIGNDGNTIILENNIYLESKKLAKMLYSSEQVVIMAATAGKEIMERIKYEIGKNSPTLGIVIDGAASELADSLLDYIMKYINTNLKRQNKKLTKHRFSPGYGDLLIENQKKLFEFLKLERIDLELTEKYMLIPEKSVIAIAGIERIDSK